MGSILKSKSSLRICHINLNSFYQRRTQLLHLITGSNIDILTLNETKLGPKSNPHLPGFDIIRRDNRTISGGIAIAFRNELDVRQMPIPGDPANALLVEIHLPRQTPFHLVTLYTQPLTQDDANLLEFLAATFPRLIILADLNCHHHSLLDRTTTQEGEILVHTITNSRLRHHLTPYTRFPTHAGQQPTCPDKLLSTADISSKITNIHSGHDIGSDHVPLLLDLKIRPYPYKLDHPRTKTITDYKNADWELFTTDLTATISPRLEQPSPTTPALVDDLNQFLIDSILHSKSLAVPSKSVIDTPTRLPPDILALIKAKRRARRMILRDPASPYLHDVYRQLANRVRSAMRSYHEERVVTMCDKAEANFRTAPKTFWRLVSSLNNRKSQPSPLLVDGNLVTDSEGKAAAFREHLARVHSLPNHPDFDQTHFTHVNNTVYEHRLDFFPHQEIPPDLPDRDLPELLQPITPQDIHHKLTRLRNTAPGPDDISNLLLKKVPFSFHTLLSRLYTSVLHLGYTPKSWKHAHVIMILKPGKNPRIPANYRPISLTPSISKLFEKILVHRLHIHLNSHNLIPPSQAGFRPGVNMQDQILRVVTSLQKNRLTRPSILALMDNEKAFDTVWHNGLRVKLLDLQLPLPTIKLISSFIAGRSAQVRQNGQLSDPFHIRAGVPQGSSLSPLLYILFVRDVPPPANVPGCGLAQFADDTAFWFTGTSHLNIQRAFRKSIDTYLSYCRKWRMTVNAAKTQLCFFGRPPTGLKGIQKLSRLDLSVGGIRVPLSRSCTYLGVTLDSNLTFKRHIRISKKKATSRLKALRILNNRHDGCSQSVLSRIYTSVIRPVLTYAHPLLASADDRSIHSLEQSERRSLRYAFQLPPWTPNATVYDTTKIPPLRQFINKLNQSYIDSTTNSEILAPFLDQNLHENDRFTLHDLAYKPL